MIHGKWLTQKPPAIARYLATMTSAGGVLELPEVKEAIAQDAFVDNVLLGYLCTPDFLEHETALIEDWRVLRPERYAAAEGHLAVIKDCHSQFAAAHPASAVRHFWEARRKLRLAACRKIDATTTGNEMFTPNRMIAGRAAVSEKVPDLPMQIKLGTVIRATYGSKDSDGSVPDSLKGLEAVEAVERLLLPFLPQVESAKDWAARMTLWLDTDPLRQFEVTNRLFLLPQMAELPIVFPEGAVPSQYVERITRKAIEATGTAFDEFLRLGVSPYMALPLANYLKKHDALVSQYRSPQIGLAHLSNLVARKRAA
jgi:hypothetical protein